MEQGEKSTEILRQRVETEKCTLVEQKTTSILTWLEIKDTTLDTPFLKVGNHN
jgi:hypothetical protein